MFRLLVILKNIFKTINFENKSWEKSYFTVMVFLNIQIVAEKEMFIKPHNIFSSNSTFSERRTNLNK